MTGTDGLREALDRLEILAKLDDRDRMDAAADGDQEGRHFHSGRATGLRMAAAILKEALAPAPAVEAGWLDELEGVISDLESSGWARAPQCTRTLKRVALAQAGSGGGVPDGWVLMPVEVTNEMQHAYFGVIDKNLRRVETDCGFGRYSSQREAYRAMITARPFPDAGPFPSSPDETAGKS